MKKLDYYMEVKNTYKLNNYFNDHFYTDEKLLEIVNEEVIVKNNNIKSFFKYYKDKLLSYDIDDLKKIFKECNFRISHLIMTKNRSLSISRNHIEFYDYDNVDNSYYDMDNSYEEALVDLNRYLDEVKNNSLNKKVKKLNNKTFQVIDNDIVFHTIVDELNKDLFGIYIIKNGSKKYIYDFRRVVYE